jgi:serine/threonine protein kinase
VFPEVGQDFEVFRLQSLLGRGGMSRVFLARDLSLGGKQVVLKVTVDRGQEPQVQGPLDHPHIVPVNSVAYESKLGLCGLSMPYRPGMTLEDIIPIVEPASCPRKAVALWDALVRGTRDSAGWSAAGDIELGPDGDSAVSHPQGDGWQGFPIRGSYAHGVAWIIMVLARALHYAHRRQTFHRDVKPANLLLTLRHGPQLLDFNLADSPHSANQAQSALLGGTLPYMAPEQIEAFINPEFWGAVGAKADVYSLGLVMRELLTGQRPELPAGNLSPARALRAVLDRRPFLETAVRKTNPAIPHALEAIVVKCLAIDPADRYPDAQSLEHDLDRFLRHLPLRDSANPSRRERAGNWVYRQRRLLSGSALSIVLLTGAAGLWNIRSVNPHSEPRIEASPLFIGAVRDLTAGKTAPALAALNSLERKGARSSLVKFYTSLALDQDDAKQSDADRLMRQALAAPDAESALVAWSHSHDEVMDYLVSFAESRIHRADSIAEQIDNGSALSDEDRDTEYRNPTYEVARDALALAAKIDNDSPLIERLLARTEHVFRDYESAYERISKLISSPTAAARLDPRSLFWCRRLRVRTAFLWADRDLKRDAVTEATCNRLRVARTDLAFCDRYLRFMPGRDFSGSELEEYHAIKDRVRTLISSAGVELRLARSEEASRIVREAETNLGRLVEFIDSHKLNDQVPKTDKFAKQISQLKTKTLSALSTQRRPPPPAEPIDARSVATADLRK